MACCNFRLWITSNRACHVLCLALVAAVLLNFQQGGDRKASNIEQRGDREASRSEGNDEIEALVQVKTRVRSARKSLLAREHKQQEVCSTLTNHGSHFTVQIEAGTPGQKLDLLADTGSNELWVASCACKPFGKCFDAGKCFVSANRSSTFSVHRGEQGPPVTSISYGSGTVNTVIGTDVVGIGSVKATMDNSFLLAVDHRLRISGRLEGILGLGIPYSTNQANANLTQSKQWQANSVSPERIRQAVDEAVRRILNVSNRSSNFSGVPGLASAEEEPLLLELNRSLAGADISRNTTMITRRSFLEMAGVDTFQICFSDGEEGGALRLGMTQSPHSLESVGVLHWGLGLQGISVGSDAAFASTCNKVKPGQETACAAIIDSGTTMITAPTQQHLLDLYVAICDAWARCQATLAQQADSIIFTKEMKASALTQLIRRCNSWLSEGAGLNELPTLYFHVAGRNGSQQTLELTPWAYMVETPVSWPPAATPPDSAPWLHERLIDLQEDVSEEARSVCSLQFQILPWNTQKNGPIWILGSSFFYQFLVGYNLKAKTISFTSIKDTPCAPCGSGLQGGSSALERSFETSKLRPRFLSASPRSSSIDAGLPL